MDKDTFTSDDCIGEATWVKKSYLSKILVHSWCMISLISWFSNSFGNRRIPLQPLFVENSVPPMAYHVVKDEEYRGEVRVGLTFTPQVWDVLRIMSYLVYVYVSSFVCYLNGDAFVVAEESGRRGWRGGYWRMEAIICGGVMFEDWESVCEELAFYCK